MVVNAQLQYSKDWGPFSAVVTIIGNKNKFLKVWIGFGLCCLWPLSITSTSCGLHTDDFPKGTVEPAVGNRVQGHVSDHLYWGHWRSFHELIPSTSSSRRYTLIPIQTSIQSASHEYW
jgi:hypothetical protein